MTIPKPDGIVRDMQKPEVVSEHLNKMVIAKSIAQVVQRLPWIADMSAGSFQEKVTRGRGGRVSGVVLRYTELGASAVEVSVVIAEKALFEAEALSPTSEQSSDLDTVPILLRLADQLRVVIYHTTQDLGLSMPTEIDVSIDDIR
jgi:hypothetical protein